MIALGPGRDADLGITEEGIKARSEKLKKLNDPIGKLATYIAEGQGMVEGLIFPTGTDLAYLIANSIRFSIATLMEQGYLSKTMPKRAATKDEDDSHPGQYL